MALKMKKEVSGSEYDIPSSESDSSSAGLAKTLEARPVKARQSSPDTDVPVVVKRDKGRFKSRDNHLWRLKNRRQEHFMIRTHDERLLAQSLGNIEADDLALHLFCTHHMKRRLYPIPPSTSGSSIAHSAPAATIEEQKEEFKDLRSWQDKELWYRNRWDVPRRWTAWPLAPENVPREEQNEQFGKRVSNAWEDEDAATAAKRRRTAPSEPLRKALVAHLLKQVKTRMEERDQSFSYAASPAESSRPRAAKTGTAPKRRRLVPLLDDEAAQTILQPSMHRLLQKLDKLLMGLHTTRVYERRWRIKERVTHTQKPALIQFNRSTRDWSDVLGVVAMLGCWDSPVLDRTSRRCAELFEEDMEFRTFDTQTTTLPAPRAEMSQGIQYFNPMQGRQNFRCTFTSHEANPQTREFKTLYELNEHMVEDHNMQYAHPSHEAAADPLSRQLRLLVCPIPTCPLHSYISPSEKTWSTHLRNDHFWTSEDMKAHLQWRQQILEHEEQQRTRQVEAKLQNGLHVDDFLEEIPAVYKFQYTAEMEPDVPGSTWREISWKRKPEPNQPADLSQQIALPSFRMQGYEKKPMSHQPARSPEQIETLSFTVQGYGEKPTRED